MTPEELEIIEKRLNQGLVKVSDVQRLIDAMRSALNVSSPVEAMEVEEKKEDPIVEPEPQPTEEPPSETEPKKKKSQSPIPR